MGSPTATIWIHRDYNKASDKGTAKIPKETVREVIS